MKKYEFQYLGKLTNAPQFLIPWLDLFYEPVEIEIIRNIRNKLDQCEPDFYIK